MTEFLWKYLAIGALALAMVLAGLCVWQSWKAGGLEASLAEAEAGLARLSEANRILVEEREQTNSALLEREKIIDETEKSRSKERKKVVEARRVDADFGAWSDVRLPAFVHGLLDGSGGDRAATAVAADGALAGHAGTGLVGRD